MASELDQLYKHIDDIEIAMMTTRRPDGHLESRAMATQARAAGADLWFVTLEDTQKLRDLGDDPHVNLSYYKDRTREWISVSGTAVPATARRFTSCIGPTGARGFQRETTRATGRTTTRAWC